MGDHDLVTAPKYCGKWLAEDKKLSRVNQTYQKQLLVNPRSDCKLLQGGVASEPKDCYFVLSIMQLMFLMLIPKNGIST